MAYVPAQGNSRGIISLWNPYFLEGTIMQVKSNFIWVKITHNVSRKKLHAINIYVSNNLLEIMKLWGTLEDIIKGKEEENWILAREFKVIC